MTVIETLLIWGSGFAVGWWIMGKLAKAAMAEILTNLNLSDEALQEALRKSGADFLVEDEEGNDLTDAIPIRVEKVDDQLLAYRVVDNTFIAQGDTAKQLLDRIGERFEGQRFRVDENRGAKHLEGHI